MLLKMFIITYSKYMIIKMNNIYRSFGETMTQLFFKKQ